MKIDLFTLFAQIINFIILLIILWYFLFRRIIRAMDEREKRIGSRLNEAEQKRSEAEEEMKSYQSRKQELEDQKEAILAQAKEEAAARRKEMMDKARREIEENRSQWYSALQDNKDLFLKELSRRASEQIVTVSQLALRDLANEELEKQIITVFIDHIQKIEEKEEKELIHFAAQSQDKITIRSSFKVPEAEGQKIRETIQSKIKASFEVRFVSSPELLCGIELMADGYKIGWSVATYLDALKERMGEEYNGETMGSSLEL